jgi:phage recombination protein Bet
MLSTLKATAFKGDVSNEQMMALLIVADQYRLNPWTKEIYAFPDKRNGIVPVVGVDGWARIINENSQFDGMDFEQDEERCTCIIYRKDRNRPIRVTEYLSECKRGTEPWNSHPRRMLRHKAMIQCARIAFGFGGIFDPDEAERIVERDITAESEVVEPAHEGPHPYPAAAFAENLPKWAKLIKSGKKSPADIIAMASTKGTLSDEQRAAINAAGNPNEPTVTFTAVAEAISKASDADTLDVARDLIGAVSDAGQRAELVALADQRAADLDE